MSELAERSRVNIDLCYLSIGIASLGLTYTVSAIPLASTAIGGVQWLSGRVLDSRPRGHGFQSHWRHCVVVLEQDTFIIA